MANLDTIFTLFGLQGARFASQRVRTVANPGAGSNFAATVPGGRAWLLQSVRFQFATDATVANRAASLLVRQEGVEIMRISPPAVQAASLTNQYTFAAQVGRGQTGLVHTASLPSPLILLPGATVESSVENIQPGDTITAIHFSLYEFYYPE